MPLSQLAVHVGLSPISQVWLSSFLLILVWPGSCGNAEASSVLLSDLRCRCHTVKLHSHARATEAVRARQSRRIVNQLAVRGRSKAALRGRDLCPKTLTFLEIG